MTVLRGLVPSLVCIALASFGVESSFAGKDKKKDNKADFVGVIEKVHRDNDPKDKDIGHLVMHVGKKDVKITVLKSTIIMRDGKRVEFKALDKGDRIAVHSIDGAPHAASRIVIVKE